MSQSRVRDRNVVRRAKWSVAATGVLILVWLLPHARAEDERPYCFESVVTIVASGEVRGTSGDDVILAGPGPDVIRAGPGDDVVCGARGRDLIVGGAGDDRLSGDGGNDHLVGDARGKELTRGGGDDELFGLSGSDVLVGDAESFGGLAVSTGGEDLLFGGALGPEPQGTGQRDYLIGGSATGRGRVRGRDGMDVFRAGDGPDVLVGDNGKLRRRAPGSGQGDRDLLIGDEGHDVIYGGPRSDVCAGGPGWDHFIQCEADPEYLDPPFCPRGAADGLEGRELIGLRVRHARAMARGHDCVLRVTFRDGEGLAISADLRRDRINVAVRDGRGSRLGGVF